MSSGAPVAVGGVGGSGTRVVAEILRRMGFYIGSHLNQSYDNLWFTLLFKRSKWFMRSRGNPAEIYKACHVFLGVRGRVDNLGALRAIPRLAQTTGRYRGRDLGVFSREDIEVVKKIGFEVEDFLAS